jgi:predicted phage-related endonuclease
MLTEEQRQRRYGKVGASFVPYLMAGDEAKILTEWMRLVDHPDYKEEDLSDNWPVQFGSYIEDFALNWHARKTGQPLVHRGKWMPHPDLGHVGCTLDAYRVADRTVVDCKAPGRWRKLEDVIAFYPGQMVVQKACLKAARAALLVVHGGDEPVECEMTWDEAFEAEVWDRLRWFWQRVETLQAPAAIPAAKAAVPAVRVVDMTGSNEWASYAHNWLTSKEAADCFNRAAKGLKALIEDDVMKAYGHGIYATRSRAGALSIKAA